MKHNLIFIFALLNSIFFSICVVQNWNFDNSAIDLLSESTSVSIQVIDETTDSLYVKLYKYIGKTDGGVVYKNYLTISYGGTNIYDGLEVDYDKIGSYHRFDNDNIICPKGKYHPIYYYLSDGNPGYSSLSLSTFNENGDWDLKCFVRNGYFIVFYLMNGQSHLFYKKSGSSTFNDKVTYQEIYGVKLSSSVNSNNNYEYPLAYVVKDGSTIALKGSLYQIKDDGIFVNDCGGTVSIMTAATNTRGCFENDYDHFYFLTYTNTSDFACGYYDSLDSINYESVGGLTVNMNEDSPLEFVDEVEIEYIKYIYNYKYAYYKINNLANGKTYYGIIDTKKNIVVFNTEEEILTYVPYSTISMLAITSLTAYEICVIKQGGACIDSYGCTETSYNYIVDLEGNKCATSCDDGKILLIRENMCNDTCDESIYVLNSSQCGLCKQLYPDTPYKLINSSGCLAEADIPEGAEVYNSKLNLLKCKSGYKLENGACVVNCYQTCATCSAYSEDESEQKCLTCKDDYILDNNSCIISATTIITNPPSTLALIPTTIQTTIVQIPTTIQTTIVQIPTTIQTTIAQIPTTIQTTIPPTIRTTIVTTITTTIPAKVPTTIPTTIPITIPVLDNCEDEKCLTCNEESNLYGLCLSCNEEKGYKKVNYTSVLTEFYDCILNTSTKLSKYFYNETTKEYRPCYKTCKKCSQSGNENANNCLECENGYMFRPGDNPYNNCVVYSDYYYISPYNQYKALDTMQCPEESKYMVKTGNKSYCIYDCKEDLTYKYLYNGVCLKECPANTVNENNVCKEIVDECTLGVNKMGDNIIINKERTETFVRTYISEFNYTINHVSLYTNDNYNIIIYQNRDCVTELSLEMPKVDFKDCYTKVKNEIGIQEELIIVIISLKDSSGESQTYYSLFHPITGYKLKAEEICQNETIVVSQNLTLILSDEGTESYILQTSLTEQGINIFDLNDPFYTDLCYDFDNPTNRDIPLSERISTIYPNASLCEEGCEIDGIDLETLVASCNCQFNDIGNNDLIKGNAFLENTIGEVFDIINSSNILVMKCYKYIFNYFTESVGGIISTIAIALHLISTALYFFFRKNQIRVYIYSIYENFLIYIGKETTNIQNFPPKKSIKNERFKDKLIKNKKGVHFDNNVNERIKSPKGKNKLKIDQSKAYDYDAKSSHQEISKFKYNPGLGIKSEKDLLSEKPNRLTEYPNLNKNNNRKNKITKININSPTQYMHKKSQKKEGNYNQFFEKYFATSVDEMEYDDAIIKDKRTFCQYFGECLKEKQMIAFTFISSDPLKIRIVKIMLFILNFVLYFVVIGLFYSEEYISELYNIDEEDDGFFDYIPRNIQKFIYTTFVSIVISYIVDFFFIEEKKIKGIFKREKENLINLRKEIFGLIQDIQKRYLVFIIVILILLLISFYYLLCFNYVYPKTQSEWLKASLTIFVIMQILSILKCLLETCLRFLSFKCESEKLYKISKRLD